MASRQNVQPAEIASLADRMGYLQALRVGFACVVVASAVFAAHIVGDSVAELAAVTGVYLGVTVLAQIARLVTKSRGLALVAVALLIDGLYLGWVMYLTGAAQSPLRFLVYLHIVAVTLLASYRTGLKVALWHSLLTFVMLYLQVAGILRVITSASELATTSTAQLQRLSVFNVTAFWLVALGTAAFSAMNERELRRRKVDVEALAELARDLEEITQPPEIANALLAKVTETFGFDRGVVFETNEDDVTLISYKGPGDPKDQANGVDAVVRRALEEHEPVLIRRLDEQANPRLASLLPSAKNILVLGLFAENQPLGVIAVENPTKGGRIERRVVSMVGQFASYAALALRNARLLEQVQRLAETDSLTGVANRRVFDVTLNRELSRAGRTHEQLSLVMLDVDHFKSFNDTHGHQAGDEVLRGVAAALDRVCRGFDTVARYGGEEFAVILPGCTTDESINAAERLREAVSKVEAAAPITASAGVATYPVNATDAAALVKAADDALYESKRTGRDRVTRSRRTSQPAPPAPTDGSPEQSLVGSSSEYVAR